MIEHALGQESFAACVARAHVDGSPLPSARTLLKRLGTFAEDVLSQSQPLGFGGCLERAVDLTILAHNELMTTPPVRPAAAVGAGPKGRHSSCPQPVPMKHLGSGSELTPTGEASCEAHCERNLPADRIGRVSIWDAHTGRAGARRNVRRLANDCASIARFSGDVRDHCSPRGKRDVRGLPADR